MIVYGRRATALTTEVLFDPCPNCKTRNSVHMTVYSRYAHIFWVPMFPIGKTGVSVCSECRQVLKSKDMPPDLRLAFDNVKSHTKIPVWHFSGLGLVVVIVIAINVSDRQKSERVSKLILQPKAGDIFEVKLKDDVYTLFKVEKVGSDSVFFATNKYQSNEESGLSDLSNKDFDADSLYGVPRSSLLEMDKKEEIIDIERK